MTPTLAAAEPLVQGLTGGFAILAAVASAAFLVGLYVFVAKGLGTMRPFPILAGGALACVAVLCLAALLAKHPNAPGVNDERVGEVVAEKYRISSVEPAGSRHFRGSLCESVSAKSPLYAGVTDNGQPVEFRVGVADCDAEDPEAEIIVTYAPGLGESAAAALEKDAANVG